MRKHIFISSFLLFVSLPVLATLIKGQNKAYAGQELEFYQYADPVTKKKERLFTLNIDASGSFSKKVNISRITYAFSDFGIYRGMLFLEPEQVLTLRLPPLRRKNFADKKNPYFSPVEFWFTTKERDQLNDQIFAFDTTLNHLTGKHFNELFFKQSRQIYDSIEWRIDQPFKHIGSPVFAIHKQLKLKSVEAGAFRLNPQDVSAVLNSTPPDYWDHPAFLELFEKTYSNKLSFLIKSMGNTPVREAVASEDTPFLKNYLEEHFRLKSPLTDLALLKMLYDGYYSGDFPEKAILNMVSSPAFFQHQNKYIAKTAANISGKLNFLRPGSRAPVICLKNTDGHRICTDENSEKFKYLIFADMEMVVCREHLKYLSSIQEQFNKHLEIIVILLKTDLIEMKMFLDKKEIPGIHLIDAEGKYIEKYEVRSFPACFLLNENHDVAFPRAKAPLDGFETQFGSFLRKELFLRQRDQER